MPIDTPTLMPWSGTERFQRAHDSVVSMHRERINVSTDTMLEHRTDSKAGSE